MKHAQSHVLQSGVFMEIRTFMLERPEESLHHGDGSNLVFYLRRISVLRFGGNYCCADGHGSIPAWSHVGALPSAGLMAVVLLGMWENEAWWKSRWRLWPSMAMTHFVCASPKAGVLTSTSSHSGWALAGATLHCTKGTSRTFAPSRSTIFDLSALSVTINPVKSRSFTQI